MEQNELTPKAGRKHWLDNLRWATVLSVLVYHVFYMYNSEGVFGGIGGFKESQPQDIVLNILYPWFMMMLFMLAGISAAYALQKKGRREFLRERSRKLLVPSTIGLFVFQWITGYFNTRIAELSSGTDIISGIPGPARWIVFSISGIGPLWFIQDLWIFCIILLLIISIDKHDKIRNLCANTSLIAVILLGILVYVANLSIIPNPSEAQGLLNLYRPIGYLVVFLLGYFVFSHDKVQNLLAKAAIPMSICAVISGIYSVSVSYGTDVTAPAYLMSWHANLYAYTTILALMGVFRRWANRTNHFCTYMSKSSFGIYIVHYIVCAAVGYWLKMHTALPVWLIYMILSASVLIGSVALYELLHRIPIIRWCVFGEKKQK